MIIKYYNPAYEEGKFSCKKVCTKCKSIIWTKNFYDVGNFEITDPVEIPEMGDFIIHGLHCGIVCRILENNQNVKVYGYDLKGLLCFRYLLTYSTEEKAVDKIIKNIATISLCEGKRKIEGLFVEDYDNTILEEMQEAYSVENKYSSEMLKNLSALYEIGWDIHFQEEKLSFCTRKGADLTDKVIFSRGYKNIESLEYNISIFDSANVGYSLYERNIKRLCRELSSLIDSEGDVTNSENTNRVKNIIDELYQKLNIRINLNSNTKDFLDEIINSTNEVKYIGEEPEGINRRECGLLENNNNFEEALKEKKQVETITGTANDKKVYGVDYQLGDYVTVVHKDIYTIKQITKVEFVYEPCGSKIVPTFGELKDNILKKIARKV